MPGHAHRLAVCHGLGPPGVVTASVPEDPAGEHDHVVVPGPEIRIPAAIREQLLGKRPAEVISHVIVRLELDDRTHRRLCGRHRR
jgi:hypothetical protein